MFALDEVGTHLTIISMHLRCTHGSHMFLCILYILDAPLSGFLADVYCGKFITIIIGLTAISISSVTFRGTKHKFESVYPLGNMG